MRRLRPYLSLLLVVLVAAWGEGLCRPMPRTAQMTDVAPCHETPDDRTPDATSHGAGDHGSRANDTGGHDTGTPSGHASHGGRDCGACPLCAPLTPRVAPDAVRFAGLPLALHGCVEMPGDREGARPPVPPPQPRA